MRWRLISDRNWTFLVILLLASICIGCNRGHKLERTIQRELATGIQNDSLFLGLKFGITLQEFYDHCWDLNKREIVSEGPENMSVEYIFDDEDDNPIAFNFYAHIDKSNGPISQYNTTFYYYAWAPWNQDLQSSDLILNLRSILLEWFGGNKFFRQKDNGKSHFYKIDGNRMIDMFMKDEMTVVATFIDLNDPEKLEEYSNNE